MQTTIRDCPVWIVKLESYELSECLGPEALIDNDPADLVGFYWAVCQPGCIPDSEFYGPFPTVEATEAAADEHLSY